MSNPYGAPPPDPYGQQPVDPYAPQPVTPYAQQPAYPPAHGQHQPAYVPPPQDPDKRPGTVTAAGIITIISSGLSLLLFGIVLVVMIADRDSLVDEFERELVGQPGMEDLAAGDVANLVIAVMGVFVFWCLASLVLGVLVLRRQGWARVVLVISAAITGLLSLLSILSVVSIVPLIACITVVVLLFAGGANDWFARRTPAAALPVGTTQPWG